MLWLFIGVSGCAYDRGITKDQEKIDLSKKSLALFSVKFSNRFKPAHLPVVRWGHFDAVSKGARDAEIFQIGDPYKSEKDSYNEHYVSIFLRAGTYNFRDVWGYYDAFKMGGVARVTIPLNVTVEIEPNSVIYLGHIDATIRERKDGERRAGPMLPLIPQQASGFYASTVDVRVSDQFTEDLEIFRDQYPLLREFSVKKSILAPQF